MTIGDRIKIIRERMKLSQADLGKMLGVVQNTVSQYEANLREPGLDSIKIIAALGRVSIEYLISGKEYENKEAPPAAFGKWYSIHYEEKDRDVFLEHYTQYGFVVIMANDSMQGGEKPILQGDYLLCDKTEYLPGDVVLVVHEDRQIIRQLLNENIGNLSLRAWNDKYPVMNLIPNKRMHVYRVIYHQRKGNIL